MRGSMMDYPLTLTHFLERARRLFPKKEIVTRTATGLHRYTYADLYRRAVRLAGALRTLGVHPGERVATFAWNTSRHLELYLTVPSSGAVLHTLNIRLFPEQISFIVNHAEDAVIFVDESLVATLEPLATEFRSVRAFVVMGDGPLPSSPLRPLLRYEDLLADASEDYSFPILDEHSAAGMCYTSGTTGNPKGVVYSHRALVLQSLAQAAADAFALCEADVILPVVPMFHANAWGLPFTATMVGATQVYPGAQPTPKDIAQLIQDLRVTVTAGVPTVLIGLLALLEQQPYDLSSLRAVPCGGSAVPESLIEQFDRRGITVVQAWGMTETAPLATLSRPRCSMSDWSEPQLRAVRAKQGTPVPGVEMRIADEAGRELPWDGKTVGELQVRGPWIVAAYHNDPRSADCFQDGWFKTGDLGVRAPDGYYTLRGRRGDLIISGGFNIYPREIEELLLEDPRIREAAVVGVADDVRGEVPVAYVVADDSLSTAELDQTCRSQLASFKIPRAFIRVESLPRTALGKIQKHLLPPASPPPTSKEPVKS